MNKKLGKISKVYFGLGGYQESQFGLFLCLEFKGSGCWTSVVSGWDSAKMECNEHAKWTEKERSEGHDTLCRKISKLLDEAKVLSVDELREKPVEATFKDSLGGLTDWRILKEVI